MHSGSNNCHFHNLLEEIPIVVVLNMGEYLANAIT